MGSIKGKPADSVVIMLLNWNGWSDTCKCLVSLRKSIEQAPVWLVDNASSIDRSHECRRILPQLRVVRWTENLGWAGGYNRALKQAIHEGYEAAYLINNDTTPEVGFLGAVRRVMFQDQLLAAVGSMIVYSDKTSVKFDGEYYAHNEKPFPLTSRPDEIRPAKQANGAGMLVRLAAVNANGGFDERYFCYGEETEWCWRAIRNGWHIAIAPASVIYHKGEGSDINANAQYYRSRNAFLLLAADGTELSFINKVRIACNVLRRSDRLWLSGNKVACDAALTGVRDGLKGRFGRRGRLPLGFFWRAVGATWPRLAALQAKCSGKRCGR